MRRVALRLSCNLAQPARATAGPSLLRLQGVPGSAAALWRPRALPLLPWLEARRHFAKGKGKGGSKQDKKAGKRAPSAAKRLAFNSETVDVTDADSAGRWRELLAGSGVQRASVSGSGIFKDAQSDASIRARFFAGEIVAWQVAIPDFGMVEGLFQITALEYGGSHDGEMTFEIALESAGLISFAAGS